MLEDKKTEIRKNFKTFSALYLVLITIPIVISSFSCILAWHQISAETIKFQKSSLERTAGEIDAKLSSLEILLNQIVFDDDIYSFCPVTDPMECTQRYKVTQIMRSLSVYGLPNEYIRMLYVYYSNSDYIITPNTAYTGNYFFENVVNFGRFRTEEEAAQFHAQDYGIQYFNDGGTTVLNEDDERIQVSMLIRSVPRYKLRGANVVTLIDNRLFESGTKNFDPSWGFAVLDSENRLVISKNWAKGDRFPDFNELEGGLGTRRVALASGKHFLTYQTSANGLFKYVVTVPEWVFYQKVLFIILIIVLLLAVLLFAGVFLVFRSSRSISKLLTFIADAFAGMDEAEGRREKPEENCGRLQSLVMQSFLREKALETHVKELIDENVAFRKRMENNFSMVQNTLLLKLVRGDVQEYVNAPEIYENYRIHFAEGGLYLLSLGIDYPKNMPLQKKVHTSDTILFLLRSLLAGKDKKQVCYVCSMDTDTVLLVLSTAAREEERTVLRAFALRMKVFIECNCSVTCAVGISGNCKKAAELNKAYKQSLKCLDYRMIDDSESIVLFEDIHGTRKGYDYSVNQELSLIRCLRDGDFKEGVRRVQEIIQRNMQRQGMSLLMARCLFFDLLSTAFTVADEMNIPLDTVGQPDELVHSILCAKSIEEMRELLLGVFDEITTYVSRSKKENGSVLGQEILQYIEENHLRFDFSQQAAAEYFSLSASALSQFFKEYTGTNFSDYVKDLRTKRAGELLRSTDLSLQEISAQVGYGCEHTLIRVFKQRYGVTPGNYRQSVEKNVAGKPVPEPS